MTWDHPRGHDALAASAGDLVAWDAQPLEGFESHPVDGLAARYDLVVLDHPHLGEAVAAQCLTPLDELFDPGEIAAWDAASIGSTLGSYRYDGRLWALPLDAAAQVCATRPDLLSPAPTSWAAVLDLDVPVALSLAGPHAFLTFCSVAAALGEEPAGEPGALLTTGTGLEALRIMRTLAGRAPVGTAGLSPIGLLERMSGTDDVAVVPLVYGYVNYSGRVRFTDAPDLGSTLGGTGLAVSRRCRPTPQLLDHVRWLMSPAAQREFIPNHAGQPSARAAWVDPVVDAAAAGFYSGTARTVEHAWVRPRHPGYIGFQGAASALLREVLTGRVGPRAGLTRLQDLYRSSLPTPEMA
jgi:multiple sugar transport system substrate-binding protein